MQVTADREYGQDNLEINKGHLPSGAKDFDEISSDPYINSESPSGTSALIGKYWQQLVALALWISFIGLYIWYIRVNQLTPLESVRQLIDLMRNSAYGSLIFILIYAIRPLIFFSATLLTVASGYLFGPLVGVVLTVIASNLSAMIAYIIGRYFGGNLLEDENNDGFIQRYTNRLRSNSFETVLIMRFIFMPYDVVNYLSGLLRIDWKAFLFATIIGAIPGTISFVLLGASIQGEFGSELPTLDPLVLTASILLFVGSLGLSRYLKHREQVQVSKVVNS